MGKQFDPEAAARSRNAEVLAGAGIDRPGYAGPGLGQRGGMPGVASRLQPQGPAHAGVAPTASFADDYGDPMLAASAGMQAARAPELPSQAELLLAAQVACPDCGMRQSAGHKKCANCNKDLSLSAAEGESDLLLAELSSAERNNLKESDFAIPSERRYPIHDISHARNALARCSGKPEESTVKAAVYKKYPSLKPGGEGNLSQEGHAISFYDTLKLAKKADDGVVWKAICKTGELALSPGPGQIDVDKPLKLTKDLFDQLVLSVQEKAFPYVTIPTTHANGLLENTGYVRDLKVEPSADPADPPGTEVLWAAMDFTEPEIKSKIERGTIPDTSVGVKFGYRNKRSGKTYPAALEHVALTHQPWVDGLTPFGAGLSQEGGVFDVEEATPEWEGVYMSADAVEGETEDILPEGLEVDGIPASFFSSEPMKHTRQTRTRRQDPDAAAAAARAAEGDYETVEQLLAAQQVQIEAKDRRVAELELRLSQNEGRTSSQAAAMHLANVAAKVQEWEKAHMPPAFIKEAKAILLAAGPEPAEVTEDNAVLTLSITPEPKEEGEVPQPVEAHLSVQGIIDRLALSVPRFAPDAPVADIMQQMDELHAAQKPGGEKPSAEDRAKNILEEAQMRASGAGMI